MKTYDYLKKGIDLTIIQGKISVMEDYIYKCDDVLNKIKKIKKGFKNVSKDGGSSGNDSHPQIRA